MWKFVADRLKERSTWLGIIAVLTTTGVSLTPEQAEALIAAGVAIAGLIMVFTKDPKPTG